ncbi:MAG TPA: cupin domain-containing protein [bacterium]|nr:cupin domain-containing protein [bacterium]
MSEGAKATITRGDAWTAADLGPIASIKDYRFLHEPSGLKARGKVFGAELLGAKGLEISWNTLPPGAAVPFAHSHRQNEELYLFLSGTGEMLLDGAIQPVREGSMVRVEPKVARAWRNVGADVLVFLVIQYRADSEIPLGIKDGAYLGPAAWPLAQQIDSK